MLIWITGTIGAGKGVIVEYLVQKWFRHYSARQYFTELLQEQWVEVTRPNMIILANGLREKYGGSYIIDQLVQQAIAYWWDAVVESIRAVDEVTLIKSSWWLLIGVTADQQLRYERVVKRGTSLDHITFEQFQFDEHYEWSSPDPTKSNIFACLPYCDRIFVNEWTVDELYTQLEYWIHSQK